MLSNASIKTQLPSININRIKQNRDKEQKNEIKQTKMTLKDSNTIVNAIGFNLGYLADEYRIGDKIDVVGTLEINTFNGVDNLQINIKDVMKSI